MENHTGIKLLICCMSPCPQQVSSIVQNSENILQENRGFHLYNSSIIHKPIQHNKKHGVDTDASRFLKNLDPQKVIPYNRITKDMFFQSMKR